MTRDETRRKLIDEVKAMRHLLGVIDPMVRNGEFNIREMAGMRRTMRTLFYVIRNTRD